MIKIIKEVNKEYLLDFLYKINEKDDNLIKEINQDKCFGIFQFGGGLAEQLVKRIVPRNFNELVAINSLARPGTSSFADQYKENRDSGKRQYHKKINELLEETYGIILFQEQAMSIFNKIGGFSLEETNEVRSVMKKLSKAEKDPKDLDKWKKTVERFKIGASESGLTKVESELITNDILKFSSYSFNKSHAVSYTYIAIMTLYLSYYFRKYFYSAVLHYEVEKDDDNLLDRLKACKAQGFDILPTDINSSKTYIAPLEGNRIIFGLADVKYVSSDIAEVIIENRPYSSLFDFIIKTQGKRINSRTINALISVGAFESLTKERKRLKLTFEKFHELKKSVKVIDKLEFIYKKVEKEFNEMPGLNTTVEDLKNFEFEYLGFNFFNSIFTVNFMEKIYELNKKGLCNIGFGDVTSGSCKTPVLVCSTKVFNDKNGKEMCFIELEDFYGEKIKIPIFQSLWKTIKEDIVVDKIHLINLYRTKENQIMFGRNGWVDNEVEIKRMIKRLDNIG